MLISLFSNGPEGDHVHIIDPTEVRPERARSSGADAPHGPLAITKTTRLPHVVRRMFATGMLGHSPAPRRGLPERS